MQLPLQMHTNHALCSIGILKSGDFGRTQNQIEITPIGRIGMQFSSKIATSRSVGNGV